MTRLLAVLLLSLATLAHAQQENERYNQAVRAYQRGDYPRAEQIWKELSDQGDPNAQYALGVMNLKKQARKSSDNLAFQYLVEAAKQQHVASMFNLGVAYWEGRGVTRQPEKAANWWEAAAEKDDPGAQFNLGLVYYTGIGRPQDSKKAIYWLQKAADNGHAQAQGLLLKFADRAEQTAQTESPLKKTPAAEQVPAIPDSGKSSTTTTTERVLEKKKQPQQSAAAMPTGDAQKSMPVNTTIPAKEDTLDVHQASLENKKVMVLRAAPDGKAPEVLTLKHGAPLKQIKSSKGWSKVLPDKAYPVWVHKSLLEDTGSGYGKIKANQVNVRPLASKDNRKSPPLGRLNRGERVKILLKRDPWVKIVPSKPMPAWIQTNDLR